MEQKASRLARAVDSVQQHYVGQLSQARNALAQVIKEATEAHQKRKASPSANALLKLYDGLPSFSTHASKGPVSKRTATSSSFSAAAAARTLVEDFSSISAQLLEVWQLL